MKSIFVLLLVAACACAQIPDSVWSRAYGVNDAHWKCVGMVQTNDGGFVIAGNEERGERESDFHWLKVSAQGDSLSSYTANWDEINICHSIARTEDDYLLMSGASGPFFPPDRTARLVKATEFGTHWHRSYPGSDSRIAYSAIEAPWQEYLFAGLQMNGNDSTAFVLRLSRLGDPLMSLNVTGSGVFVIRSLAAHSDSTYVVAGHTTWSSNGMDDFWFRKYYLQSPAGIGGVYGGPARDRCEKIIATSDGGYLLAGVSLSYGQGDQDILLIKINEFGDSLWSQTFGGVYFDDFGSVVETSFGSYLVVGTHEDENDGNFDMLIGSCDANGEHRQQSFVGGSEEDVGVDMVPLDSGVVMFVGHTRSLGGEWRKLWLMRAEYRPHITIDRGSITFGAAQIGDSVVRTLNIFNAGGVELVLDSLIFPSGYHVNVPLPITLSAGQELPLEIVFAPQQIGAHVGNMTIYSNALEGPLQVRLVGSGQGAAADDHNLLPEKTEIISLYPNPFNVVSEVKFSVPQRTLVTLELFNTAGRSAQTLVRETLPAGTHVFEIDGRGLATGLYFVRLKTSTTNDIRKLILLR